MVALGALALGWGPGAQAADDAQELVDRARFTAEKMLSHPDYPTLRKWMSRAKGALVVPSLLKAGFLIGGEGGSGVLLARDPVKGWSYPAFYSLRSGSIGPQIGFQDAQAIFVIMTDKGLRAMIDQKMKLGAEASVAIGPTGGGVEGATTAGLGADIYSFSITRGAFAGASFEGTVAVEKGDLNRSYYGSGANAKAILLDREHTNRSADKLLQALRVK